MTETIITVQGSHTEHFPAERATVRFTVEFDGAERDSVFASATRSSNSLRDRILAIHDEKSGPITRWSSDSVRVWGNRPWNEHGNQLAIVYHASIDVTAKFDDFEVLAQFVEESLDIDGVSIGNIEWTLTEKHTRTVMDDVLSKAVADAVAKATVYAKAVGLGTVTAVAIADPGMLGDRNDAGGEFGMERTLFMKAGDAGDSGRLSLKPRDIQVSSTVDARFVAS
ncbi:MAG: SIMPL domain-containing protein [Cryobacterium sp.]|nr:SIMPL domain-containing protein [Cryobacterium sp.]